MNNPSTQPRIEGRVAAILSTREIVINIGLESGVRAGKKFAILAATPIEVVDPASGEILDTIDREKVRVEVREVRPKIAICRTYRMLGSVNSVLSTGFSSSVIKALSEARPETLRIEDSQTPPPLSEEESYVKVNDRVIEVDER